MNLFEAFNDELPSATAETVDAAPDYRGRLTTSTAALAYMTAGKATVTLVSEKTGARFTYRLTASEDGGCFFVGILTGSDNDRDYSYAGRIARHVAGDRFWPGRKTPRAGDVPASAPSSKAFDWSFRALVQGTMPRGLEIWHEARCGRCGRKLTVPSSVGAGFGPECITKVGM